MAATLTPSARLEALDAPAHIADVTLTVRDAGKVAAFYEQALGLARLHEEPGLIGLGAPDGTVLLRLAHRPEARPAQPRMPGLFHTAFLLPARADLGRWLRHVRDSGVLLEGAADHLVSEAIYLSDPEGNGIEVYVDRPRAEWPRRGGGVVMDNAPIDGEGLLALGEAAEPGWRFPAGGRIGHVHLKVADIAAAAAFYVDKLGLEIMTRFPGAAFLGWGGYHHHIGINEWRAKGAAPAPADASGLAGVEIALAGGELAGLAGFEGRDPSGNLIRVARAA